MGPHTELPHRTTPPKDTNHTTWGDQDIDSLLWTQFNLVTAFCLIYFGLVFVIWCFGNVIMHVSTSRARALYYACVCDRRGRTVL